MDQEPTADLLAQVVAHQEIGQLAAHYAVAVDARDIDALVRLFIPDVQVGAERGRGALARSFDASLRAVGVTILHVGTHAITLEGPDEASGQVYCKGEIQDGDRLVHQAILYRDRYRRVDGHWYFVRRQHLLFYGAEVGRNPLGLPPANWPEHHDGWGTVPECWESWRRFWDGSPPPRPGARHR